VLPSGLPGGPIVLEALLETRTDMNPGSINSDIIEELTCMDIYFCDFDRCVTLVLILYGDVIFSIGCLGKLMMWCPLILINDTDLEDDGVWHVVFFLKRYSFIFIGGHHSLRIEM
jgi:hypothetical protein